MLAERYSVLAHVGRSVWGNRYGPKSLLAMMTAYFDNSDRKGFTIVAGWIASVEEWDRFEVDWRLFLASYKVPYFHMKEFAHSEGPYRKWKGLKYFRARFIREAWDVIRPQVRCGFISFAQDVLFNRVNRTYQLQETIPNEYALAGRVCIEFADQWASREREQCRCIFDDPGGGNKCALMKVADLKPRLPNPIFEHSRDIPDRKRGIRPGLVHLQSADFLAYEVQKFVADYAPIRSGAREARFPLRMFGEKKPKTYFWTEERLIGLCEKFRIKRRLVVELQDDADAKDKTTQ